MTEENDRLIHIRQRQRRPDDFGTVMRFTPKVKKKITGEADVKPTPDPIDRELDDLINEMDDGFDEEAFDEIMEATEPRGMDAGTRKVKTINIHYLDGIAANRRLTNDLIVNDPNNPHVHVQDRKLTGNMKKRLEHQFKELEKQMDLDVPDSIPTVKTTLKNEEILVFEDASEIDDATIVSPFLDGKFVVINRTRDKVYWYELDDDKVKPFKLNGWAMELMEEICACISFFCTFTAMITRGKGGVTMVLLDCINFNGKDIMHLPYHERRARLREIIMLLVSDSFEILPSFTFDKDDFLKKLKKSSKFFLINPDHDNKGNDMLLKVASFQAEDNGEENVFGKDVKVEKERDEEELVPNVNDPEMIKAKVKWMEDVTIKGKRIHITGRIKEGVEHWKEIVKQKGGSYQNSITKGLDYLVLAKDPSQNDISKADDFGVPKISVDQFKLMVVKTK